MTALEQRDQHNSQFVEALTVWLKNKHEESDSLPVLRWSDGLPGHQTETEQHGTGTAQVVHGLP